MTTETTTAAPTTASAAASDTEQYVPKNDDGTIAYDAVVDVTHGYGMVPPAWRNLIDRYLFIGGIRRNVPYQWVVDVRKKSPSTVLYTFKPGASPADFARVTGLSPELLDPVKQAALLAAMQPHEIVTVMGREAVVALCEKLLDAVGDTRTKPGQQRKR